MKKIIILNIAALLFAGSAFADATYHGWTAATKNVVFSSTDAGVAVAGWGGFITQANAARDGKIGTLSTNVGFGFNIDGTNGNAYAIITQHSQATRAFGTAFNSTRIYAQTVQTKGAGVIAPTFNTSQEFDDAKWKSL